MRRATGSSASRSRGAEQAVRLLLVAPPLTLANGDHRTIVVREASDGFRLGTHVLAYPSGPDNEPDYVAFANVPAGGAVNLWRRFHRRQVLARRPDVRLLRIATSQ